MWLYDCEAIWLKASISKDTQKNKIIGMLTYMFQIGSCIWHDIWFCVWIAVAQSDRQDKQTRHTTSLI